MQFTLRQLLIVFTALAIWFGLVARGQFLFGNNGLLLYGALLGVTVVIGTALALHWSHQTVRERVMLGIAITVSLLAWFFVRSTYFKSGFDHVAQQSRLFVQLQSELNADRRFKTVRLYFPKSPRSYSAFYLNAKGTVANDDDLGELRKRVMEKADCHIIRWEVDVTSPRENGEQGTAANTLPAIAQ